MKKFTKGDRVWYNGSAVGTITDARVSVSGGVVSVEAIDFGGHVGYKVPVALLKAV